MEKEEAHHIRSKTASNEPVVSITGLKKSFGNNQVLKGFDLKLNKNESVAILGKSGSGKSVLIKCIVGLVEPDAGSIKVFGEDLLSLNLHQLNKLRARIGFLFQSNALYDSMTIRENLEFPMRRLRMKKSLEGRHRLISEALQSVGLPETENLLPAELSGGMKKRIGLARTLILNPEIILYDEPTTGLDPITAKGISELMNKVREKYNNSSLIISHDMSCIKRTAGRIIVLMDGINYAEGTFEELKRSDDKRIKEFFE